MSAPAFLFWPRRGLLRGDGAGLRNRLAPVETLVRQILARDERDSKTTPLVPAEGAVVIDSTGKTLDEVVGLIASLAKERAAT